MERQRATIQHNFWLTIEEEQRFIQALVKKYKGTHGIVIHAIRQVILEWIKKVEAE